MAVPVGPGVGGAASLRDSISGTVKQSLESLPASLTEQWFWVYSWKGE